MATIISAQYRTDKLTVLNHSAGTIFMPAGAVLTIGGLQFTTDAQKSVVLPALTALSRYQVFAVRSGNDVALVISQSENSVGPAGYTSWKLVGAFYSTGTTVVGFDEFTNIEGAPEFQKLFFRYYSTAAQSFATSSAVQLLFPTKATGPGVLSNMPDNIWNGSQATIPVAGLWKATIAKDLLNLSAGGVHFIVDSRINGTIADSQELQSFCTSSGEGLGQSRPVELYLNANDILTFFSSHTNGATRASSANAGSNYITLELVQPSNYSKVPLKDR